MKNFLLMLLGALFALPAMAVEFDYIYKGQTLTYRIISEDEKTVEVSGWRSANGEVELPETVEYKDSNYTLTQIGYTAFYGCRGLTSVEIPNSVTTIGERAFNECSSLTSVTIPNSVTTIGERAFYECSSLTSVTIGNSVTTIEYQTFSRCSGLTSVTIGNSVTTFGREAFSYCSGLTSIEIPTSVTTIGDCAFAGCISLTDLQLPETVTNIGSQAFSACQSLTVFHWPSGTTYIPDWTFANCSRLEKVYIPDKVTSIDYNAFFGCSSLRSMMIPEGINTITTSMLANCTSIQEILIPNSVTKIESNAFANCTSLSNIDLGTKLYYIGDNAFYGCDNLTSIHSMALNPPYAQPYTFPIDSYTKATVTVREQSLTRYNQENPWYRFENYLTVSGTISLSHYQVDMAGNEVFQLGVYGAQGEIEWSSSNPAVAYANECGLIVGMGITGSTVITANVDGEEVKCTVTVSAKQREARAKVRSYASSNEEEAVAPVDIIMEGVSGNPPMVNVRLVPIGASTVIDWTSSDDALATVENGIVTVHGDGEVEFGVETENGLSESIEADTEEIASVKDITAEADAAAARPNDIYNMQGVCLKRNATQADVDALVPGLYIVGGKKVLVK